MCLNFIPFDKQLTGSYGNSRSWHSKKSIPKFYCDYTSEAVYMCCFNRNILKSVLSQIFKIFEALRSFYVKFCIKNF